MKIGLKIDLSFSHNWKLVMKTDSNVYILFFLKNWVNSLIELKSNSQFFFNHLLVPLVLFLTWDYYSYLIVIIIFFILLLLFSRSYSSLFINITFLFTTIIVLPFLLLSLYWYYFFLIFFSPLFFPIADIFLTWCYSFHVMKSFNYLII